MKKIFFLLSLIVIICLGCTDKGIKPSADSLSATDAFNIIDIIKTAYEEKDRATLHNHMVTMLAEDTMKGLLFEKAGLTITPRMVTITEDSLKVNIIWSGSWSLMKDRKLENRGVADLVFHKETMKLTYIYGDNPFTVPSEKSRSNSFPVMEH
ncbi:MAG: hypothetical protein C4581_07405 [Nitrospiraceae bacterium]|nr:MAG: hypothetical protein C4581_07405 [Nitrospiraceae bacterium]